jgi:eukaryotic-like serine/threonine-protein kinase
MKSGFWRSDWFLGALVVVVVLLFSRLNELLPSLERKAYDVGLLASSREPHPDVVVIAIDETSLANIGRWPWQRDVLAKMTDILAGAKPKLIASTILLSEPQVDKGYQYVSRLLDLAAKSPPVPDAAPRGAIVALLKEAEQELNTDRKLADSYARAGNVLMPMSFTLGLPLGKADTRPPDYVAANAVPGVKLDGEVAARPTRAVEMPIEILGRAAAGIGHLNNPRDVDGTVRTEPLLVQHYDQLFPSLSLMVAAKSLNLGPADIAVARGESVSVGRLHIPTDLYLQMNTYFYKAADAGPAFQMDSFYDVYSGKIAPAKYAGKIVLLGATAAGLGAAPVTPVAAAMPPVLLLAHSVSSILQEHFIVAPAWGGWAELLVILFVGLYVIVLLPRLAAGTALAVSSALFVAILAAHMSLMASARIWLQLMLPATLVLVGYAALVSKRFIVSERAKLKSDERSAESNRMLGLAYQGQGQLDLAWDKFRQVPLSDQLLDNLYSLALDFERKRQFNKAESVLRSMHAFNPKFRDLETRLSRAKQLSETVMLSGSSHPAASLQLGVGEKPKFGRFEVQKELGKGAMGVVYLGKDPKIGREVAIKTLALSEQFDAEELAEVKERFFREAETAGRLSHPNVVTIYDTGEEHDFCYIAMELLKGGDLAAYVKPGQLLPVDKVVSIVARVADALGYAHRQGVVHRDVKPANMMYHLESDTLKVTDFGIARLTDASRTRTGMVLGTPSYMSPEQLAGKKIEGRSDLFSLGVSLYQLLCGKLPFEGESMPELMFKIANEPPTDIRSVNPSVPPALVAFLQRALAKNPDERFESGEQFAGALRAAL